MEFPSRITGIVGPNGSGKSNITEGIRWVLGEQSMKSLRGKKGEDLIWNGSPQVPRMGKAAVTLYFDNTNAETPVDFEEVVLMRKIFRDGLNEYYVNDAQVRLKDVVELMAHAGLGEAKHNIISQGEVDRMLLSSARDRREMFEEALGLRVYQIKKRETERKLEQTETNIKQVEALVREIAPHLKFLRAQSEKSKTRGIIESELKQFEIMYCVKERDEIAAEKRNLSGKSDPLHTKREAVKRRLETLAAERAAEEKKLATEETHPEAERIMRELSGRQRELERELGRLEGKLEAEERMSQAPQMPQIFAPNPEFVRELVRIARQFLRDIKSLLDEEDRISVVRSHVGVLASDLEAAIKDVEGGAEEERSAPLAQMYETESTIRALQEELAKIGAELSGLQREQREARERMRQFEVRIREIDLAIRTMQDEERDLTLGLERFRFDEERIAVRKKAFLEELSALGLASAELERKMANGYGMYSSAELKKRAERLEIKLEEVGGIDPSVIREYEETNARYIFLEKEIEDLRQASDSLRELIRELDCHIEQDFHEGFSKIKEEFHNYFRVIFGGGRASLDLTSEHALEESEESEIVPGIEGIEISVDLPRKRIQGLAMLSGGERALTAIALLFAITAVNPPPFLILDETDAALDEANSRRYGAILKELSQKTQLLLVTHNRETMKCAGALYGVTMGEDGTSKLLSLKFEEAEVYTNR